MKLYIPELGDMIKLTEDWKFDLHDEHRNTSLWREKALSENIIRPDPVPLKAVEEKIKNIESRCTIVENPNAYSYMGRRIKTYASAEDREKHYSYIEEYRKLQQRGNIAVVTLKADTVLKVDRIYIRKGASEYSSITFFVWSEPGPVPAKSKKKARFWAKLQDCNNINFERVT
jgi:hypothetical protein